MTLREALLYGNQLLRDSGIETAYLDAVILLSHSLECSKEGLFTRLNEELHQAQKNQYESYLDLRRSGIPVSYIRKKKEFYGLEFYVDERVLVPRPETEVLVEAALELSSSFVKPVTLHDAFTGSGAVAVTIKNERPEIEVSASDRSPQALEVAEGNAASILGEGRIPFYKSDLLSGVPGTFNLITSNPPYLSRDEVLKMRKNGWPEPLEALDGGKDGLEIIEAFLPQALDSLDEGGYLLLEADARHMASVFVLMKNKGLADIEIRGDLAGRERIAIGKKT